ncbi:MULTISPECIES: molybdenum cofactor biosynthesis protein B [unclassified Gordonia (in: high G+C Gram-positive bacteria)]|mgnify:CR=1 FL=1|uniref:MogA/MoaB family molybdenum cofactor biosynthesis protein n=1 Tax=unclassified Gordonia (in: high G+C Gram-positive bacteria) TaxID=2657482 RepID=UPI001F0E5BA9|nr:MogA/MoaB family molybdenum cofactor biosynthesis protein [Gordonia sp. ABSL49_1]MCH5643205.1 MogA/MoaB family molybdenum cofactor biosynthesis protein [Gordonia sp. ABSL49_1]
MSDDAAPGRELRAWIVVASTRAGRGQYLDRSGPIIAEWLTAQGFVVDEHIVVADGPPVGEAIRAALYADAHLVITTGGTGLTPTDRTPEETRQLLDFEIPGLADAIRAAGLPAVPTAVLSRGTAGVAGSSLVVNLPGSTGGVRDGLEVLAGVVHHAIDQIHGGDHR